MGIIITNRKVFKNNKNMKIGKELKALRIEAGLTQAQIAAKLGLGYKYNHVSAIENDKRGISFVVIDNWARACGCLVEISFHEQNEQ